MSKTHYRRRVAGATRRAAASDSKCRNALVTPIDRLHDRLRWVGQQLINDDRGCSQYHAFCPAHEPDPPLQPGTAPAPPNKPLRIFIAPNGSVDRFECDAGCTQHRVLAALGMRMTDLLADALDGDRPAHQATARSANVRFEDLAYLPVAVRMSDVQGEALEWLWPGRIPLGKLTVIAGDPGLGKTFLTHDIAARVSTGCGWPDAESSGPNRIEAGEVILLSAEDGLADTIHPRLLAAKADLRNVIAFTSVCAADGRETSFNLARDLDAMDTLLRSCRRPRLVVIDPISAFLPDTDSHNNAEVRSTLAPLVQLAERHRVAIVAINHLNKGGGVANKAIYRSMGSLAFIAAARAGWLVARSDDDPERRLLLVAKMNLVKEPTGLSYRIVDSRLQWDAAPVTISADQALGGQGHDHDRERSSSLGESSRLLEAIEFLKTALRGGPMNSRALDEAARSRGITPSSLRRARSMLGALVHRHGLRENQRTFVSLPGGSEPSPAGEVAFDPLIDTSVSSPAHAPR